MNSAEYQLTVKSANQKVDDYTLNCRSDWTVSRLKQHISETHVNRPNIKDQRLIYAGNLLKDSLTLRQVFFRDSLCTELTNSDKTDFTIHLVCSNSSHKPQPASRLGSSPLTTTQPAQERSARPDQANLASSGQTNGAPRATNNAANQTPTFRMSSTQMHDIVSNLMQSEQMRQQLATLQQLANSVATELTQNLTASLNDQASARQMIPQTHFPLLLSQLPGLLNFGQPIDISTHATTSPPIGSVSQTDQDLVANFAFNRLANNGAPTYEEHNLTGDNNVNDTELRHQPVGHQTDFGHPEQAQPPAAVADLHQPRVQAPQAPIIEQPVPAQPRIQPVNADPVLQHDVIDWVYYSIRAMVLIAALYIHASLFRLLFIFGLLAIAFFFSRRSNRRQNQPAAGLNVAQVQQAINAENRGMADNDVHLEQGGNLRRRRVEGENAPNGDSGGPNVGEGGADGGAAGIEEGGQVGQVRVSFLKLCYLTVTDFLASLVPE